MEVDNRNFWSHLPTILDAIADAELISLSLVGVPNLVPSANTRTCKDELYHELVEHSKFYHVSKVGLTCLQYDEKKNEYVARSFNFAISPWFLSTNFQAGLIAKTVDRKYSFTYDTLKQLRTNGQGWDHGKAWERGIPYLTPSEAQTAEERFLQPWESKKPLDVSKLDVEAKKFRNWVHGQIKAWLGTEDRTLDLKHPSSEKFTGLQVGLVCQLVHSCFDECRATPKDDNRIMQIKKLSHAELNMVKMGSRRTDLTRQSGFLYVVKAFLGEQFAEDIEAGLCLEYVVARDSREELVSDIRDRLRAAESRNKLRRPILLVQSQLDMLCNFCSTFLGRLPQTLDEFTRRVHNIFPRIVDTSILYPLDNYPIHNRRPFFEFLSAAAVEEREGGPRVTEIKGFEYNEKMAAEHDSYQWHYMLAFLKMAATKLQKEPWLNKVRPQKTCGSMRMKPKKPSRVFSILNPFAPNNVISRRASICSSVASGMNENVTTENKSASVFDDGADDEEDEKEKQEIPEVERLPPWEAAFWEKFGNKLVLDDGEVLTFTPSTFRKPLRKM
ncbi:ribonuclease H-like domain-containing protein [Sordaria brevicollis]|uniref:Ribonuclease H-like domain-containing protein n=1 Tax=Sordaria brevicollis TaxID=83679 RepID=A0AAE0PG06_SORBR|nr:ribonuclease H-like domain-containing protein [Sordaria brevicollis]